MKKVLLVDKLKTILEKEKGMLDRDTVQVFTATSGKEAIAVHRREKVDIIIMDIAMPDMPGDEVCQVIRQEPGLKKVSIILASLADGEEERERCRKCGANDYIRKPISRDDLTEKIAALLGISARQAIRMLVKVKIDGKVGGDFFIANTVDVSQTGLLFECEREIPLGGSIEVSFFLPVGKGYDRVVAKADIVRAVPSSGPYKRYGVKFDEFKEGTPELISDFISKKESKA